ACAGRVCGRGGRDGALGDNVAAALQNVGPKWPRSGKEKALAEAHVVVEEVDDERLVLDPVGDKVDAKAGEEIREIRGMHVASALVAALQEKISRDLDEADAALGERARIDFEVF